MRLWRISDRRTFQRLRADGARRRAGPVTITVLPEPAGTPPRVAFAVSAKVGGAVVRNRLRRQLRAIVAAADPPPGAYLIAVRPEAAGCSAAELRGHVAAALAALEGQR